SAGDVVDVEPSAGFFGAYPPKAEREDRSLGDDEEAPQLGKAGDRIMREAVGGLADALPAVRQRVEGHHRQRGAARWLGAGLGPCAVRWCRRYRNGAARNRSRSRVADFLPRLADRLEIESLGLVESRRGRQVPPARVDAPAPGETA